MFVENKYKENLKTKCGFTLVELLVVISIIALLLAVLMPSLGKARQQAQRVVCSTHLKQFGMAWMLYCEDYDGKSMYKDITAVSPEAWFYNLSGYLGKKDFEKGSNNKTGVMKILKCPSAKLWRNAYPERGDLNGFGGANYAWRWPLKESAANADPQSVVEGGYAINNWMLEWADNLITNPDDRPRFYKRFNDASSNVPLLADAAWGTVQPMENERQLSDQLIDYKGGGLRGSMGDGSISSTSGVGLARLVISRHGRATNVLFKGMHIKKIDLEKLWKFPWHKTWEIPKYDLYLPLSE